MKGLRTEIVLDRWYCYQGQVSSANEECVLRPQKQGLAFFSLSRGSRSIGSRGDEVSEKVCYMGYVSQDGELSRKVCLFFPCRWSLRKVCHSGMFHAVVKFPLAMIGKVCLLGIFLTAMKYAKGLWRGYVSHGDEVDLGMFHAVLKFPLAMIGKFCHVCMFLMAMKLDLH